MGQKVLKLLILLFTLTTNLCLGQAVVIDSCGLDSSATLNKYEVQYFNEALEEVRSLANFDFQKKQVGFAYGNLGKELISKKAYFDMWGKAYFQRDVQVTNELIILTQKEKQASGGYDAIIVSWSKAGIFGKYREQLIEKFKAAKQ
jgi:ABC-type transport system involved in Fe-S cluster assembly fused permease/ATPase subunit